MKSFSFYLLSAALFVAGVSAQGAITVNTPQNVVQCAPLLISWTGGTGPYLLSVHSGNDINGTPLISFPSTTATSLTWAAVNFTAGTSLDLDLRDSTGASAQSAIFTVQTGGDSSCLNGGTATSGSQAAAGSTAAGGSTAATPAATTATTPAASGSTPATSKAAAGSSSSAKASSTNAAMPTGITYGAAGLLGGVIAAVFV